MEHAWCRDPSRDERVRAAEDGRTEPLPTLGECIVAPFAEAAERSVEVSKTGEGQSGMRTERITLEVTHKAALSAREWHMWRTIFDPRYGESVRVVEEPHFDDLAQVAMQRDAAIREREAWKLLADRTNERLSAAEARVAELEQQIGQADAEDADTGYALRLFVDGRRILSHELGPTQAGAFLIAADHLAKYIREEYKPITDATNSSVSDLEAASGGGEGEVDAWGVVRDGNVQSVTHRSFRKEADRVAEKWGGTVVPLYRAPPQPRGWLTGEERDLIAWIVDGDAYTEKAQSIAKGLLARSTPLEVVKPNEKHYHHITCSSRDADWIAALAAAGVAVKEVADA